MAPASPRFELGLAPCSGSAVPPELRSQWELASQPKIAPSASERFGPLLGSAASMRSMFTVLERTSKSNATILVVG